MALFKISKGTSQNLPSALTEGYCWYTYDDSKFYIDFKDDDGVLVRQAINANEAEKLTGYDITTILNSSDLEIPTSKTVLDAIDAVRASAVQTVNGIAPDENGNVEIAVGGGVTSWNDLTDKPFEEMPPAFDIQWDGVIGDKFALDLSPMGFPNMYAVKVSDSVFTAEELNGALLTFSNDGWSDVIINSDTIDSSTYAGALNLEWVFIVYDADSFSTALGTPEGYITNGTYFICIIDENYPNRFVAPTTIKTLDNKYLDLEGYVKAEDLEGYAKTEDLPAVAISGSWNDLTDRPFGETIEKGDTLVFDWEGDLTNRDIFLSCYKVYDNTLTVQDLEQGATVTYYYKGKTITSPLVLKTQTKLECGYAIFDTNLDVQLGYIITNYNSYYGEVPSSLGLYFKPSIYFNSFRLITVSLTIDGYSQFDTPIIKQINKKFIPLTEYATYEYVDYSHIIAGRKEGSVLGRYATAEGKETTASGNHSHAEGYNTTASGDESHAEGYSTTASGHYSHAEGRYTIASGIYQHVQGRGNIEDTENKYAHIVGNGSTYNPNDLSNAHTLDWSGNAWFAGDIKIGGSSYDDTTAKTIATEEYVNTKLSNVDLSNYATKEYASSLVNTEKERAMGVEDGLRADVDIIKNDYLKTSDKEEIQNHFNELFNTYILNINYESLLAFDTSEIIIGGAITNTTAILGQATLDSLILA